MNLDETLTSYVLKFCSYVGISLYRLCVPSTLGDRAVFDVETSHVLLQGVLAAITLVGDGTRDGGARAGTSCGLDFPSAQWISLTLGVSSNSKFLEQRP